MNDIGYFPLGQNYGYYIDKAPQNVLEELGQQINNLQSDFSIGEKVNDTLAGEIEHEYKIAFQFQIKQYIKDLTQRFENESQYMVTNYNPLPTLNFSDLWVNFQKKYEYNPLHYHVGIYSFVIWYKIPYIFEDEEKYSYKPDQNHSGGCKHGRFAFVSPNIAKNKINYNVLDIDKTKEGYVVIFPSNLSHMVYPFYSTDEYRITVAGNVIIN